MGFRTKQNENAPNITVVWKPYMIDPGVNVVGEEFEAYNQRRWGGSGWTHRLKQEGRNDGAAFAKWKWWPNTMKSHCLVKFAEERYSIETSKSNSVLFNALYEEGKNISLLDVLVQIGKDDLGLEDEAELRNYLENESVTSEVKSEIKKGKRINQISGVPYFIIGKEGSDDLPYGLSGAQKQQTFIKVFEDLIKD